MPNLLYTNDLSFTAYLHMCGFDIKEAKRLGKSFKFCVDLGDDTDTAVKIRYLNSESAKFDASVRDIKKILFGGS